MFPMLYFPVRSDTNSEEWTGELPPGRLGEYMRAYADTLRTSLVPQLASLNVDRTLFESTSQSVRPHCSKTLQNLQHTLKK